MSIGLDEGTGDSALDEFCPDWLDPASGFACLA